MGSSRSDGPSTPSGTSSDTCAVPCPSPAEPDLQPGGLREQDLVLPGYLGRRQDRDPPGHPEQNSQGSVDGCLTAERNEHGRQCRKCPGENVASPFFFRLVFSDAQRDAHNNHSHILFESCQSYRRRCTNRVRSTVYRVRICPAVGRARVFRCIELPFGFLQCPVVLAPFSRLEI